MNTIFSFKRFIHLFKEHWVRTWKSMVVLSVVTAGLLSIALVYLELKYDYRPLKYEEVQQSVFSLGFILISIGFCLNFYYANWYKSKKIAALSLPVSVLEWTLLSFIWMTIFFSIWYLSLFYIINIPILKWANSFELQAYYGLAPAYRSGEYVSSGRIDLLDSYQWNNMAYFILIQTLLLASLLWFKTYAFVKSISAVFIILICFGWFHSYFIPGLMTPSSWIYDANTIRVMIDQLFTEFNEIEASPFWSALHNMQLQGIWLALWGIIYFRIKEQEV